jgi:hypothetical protein
MPVLRLKMSAVDYCLDSVVAAVAAVPRLEHPDREAMFLEIDVCATSPACGAGGSPRLSGGWPHERRPRDLRVHAARVREACPPGAWALAQIAEGAMV